ncbi:MAG: hypothetical protein H7263_07670 [Candidatus Sericytochromatia bacterium]|nr:hypothetical protein [Candidatus Sericytochromatia bacterium]
MFEKFTENAIKTIMYSREEARRLEFSYVQIEHLFLGILHDKTGISALVLSKLGVELKKVRRIVERLIGRGYSNTPLEQVSFAINVMEIISNSVSMAAKLGGEAVLVEHVLLSLVNSQDENLKTILAELNLSPEDIEMEIKLLWQDDEMSSPEVISTSLPQHYSSKYLTPLSKLILDDAREETINQGHIFIGTEQILLSLAKNKFNCLAGKILNRFGLNEQSIRVEIHRIIGEGSGTNIELLENTPIVEKSLEYAWLEARRFKYARMSSGHLLAGITTMDKCTSSYMLKRMNIDPEQVRWDVLYILKSYPDTFEPVVSLEEIDNLINPNSEKNLSMNQNIDNKDKDIDEILDNNLKDN